MIRSWPSVAPSFVLSLVPTVYFSRHHRVLNSLETPTFQGSQKNSAQALLICSISLGILAHQTQSCLSTSISGPSAVSSQAWTLVRLRKEGFGTLVLLSVCISRLVRFAAKYGDDGIADTLQIYCTYHTTRASCVRLSARLSFPWAPWAPGAACLQSLDLPVLVCYLR
jgi:hypothetical protein